MINTSNIKSYFAIIHKYISTPYLYKKTIKTIKLYQIVKNYNKYSIYNGQRVRKRNRKLFKNIARKT